MLEIDGISLTKDIVITFEKFLRVFSKNSIHAQHYYYFIIIIITQRLFAVFKGPDSRRPQSTYKHHPGLTNFGTPWIPYKSMEQQKLYNFIYMPKNVCF